MSDQQGFWHASHFSFAVCWLCQTRNLTATIVKTTKNYQKNCYASDAILDHYRVSAKHYGHHDIGQSRREFSQAMARAQLFDVPVRLARLQRAQVFESIYQIGGKVVYVWRRPYVDAFQEKCGPVVTHAELPAIKQHLIKCFGKDDKWNEGFFAHNLEDFHREISQYLKTVVKVPRSRKYKPFLKTCYSLGGKAEKSEQERLEEKEEKQDEFMQKKVNNAVKAIKCVRKHVKHPAAKRLTHFKIISALPFCIRRKYKKKVVVKMRNPAISEIFRYCLLSPYKIIRNKTLQKKIAGQVDEVQAAQAVAGEDGTVVKL